MKKEIKEIKTINNEKVVRITTIDERWYAKESRNPKTGLPEYDYFPSSTWIKSYYYTSPYLIKWIAEQGLTEAERIKNEAGVRGDKIHQATEDIDKGIEINLNTKYLNKESGVEEELTADEIEGINSYIKFLDKEKPEILASEMTVFSKPDSQEKYAGTLDRIWAFKKDNGRQIFVIDLKTGKSVRKDWIIQVSSYSHADIDYKKLGITDEEWTNRKLAILQIGYNRNALGYKFTEVDDKYNLFKVAYVAWQEECSDKSPLQRDFPLVLSSEYIKGIKNKNSESDVAKSIPKPINKRK